MEIKKGDFAKKYRTLSVDKLIELYKSGNLTEVALSTLVEELKRRGLPRDEIESVPYQNQQGKIEQLERVETLTPPKIRIGFIFVPVIIAGDVIEDILEVKGLITYHLAFIALIYWLFCVHRIH